MKKRILSLLPLALVLAVFLCTPAFALTESEVEAEVAVSSKAAVTGNVLIWFLCAVAFLKVSQKIDSFMAGMGVNVGRTGGSLMAEAMIAARGVSMLVKAGGGAIGGIGKAVGSAGGTSPGPSGSTGGFFKGGLIGMAGRHITNSAVRTATNQTSAVNTAQKQTASSATHTATSAQSTGSHTASSVHTGGTHTANSVQFGGADPDSSGVIQTDSTIQSATIQSDSSVVFNQEHTSSESQSASAVFADGAAQQEGVIITGHESQSAVYSDSGSPAPGADGQIPDSYPSGGASDPYPDGGTPLFHPDGGTTDPHLGGGTATPNPDGRATVAPPDGTSQASHTANTTCTSHSASRERVHTQGGAAGTSHTRTNTHTVRQTSIGGAVFARSLASGGKFANDVIGTVARGDIRSTGSITGDLAAQSLSSYMGYTALGAEAQNIPRYSDVEIGGGRITGTETPAGGKEGLAFGMYHAAQYTAPEGHYEKVYSADGALWYRQYAQDAVERKPYKAPDGTIAYDEKIVKKLPTPPRRKNRI